MSRHLPETTYLSKIDPVMKRLIGDIGFYVLPPRSSRSPFESLVRAVASQQLQDKAAESILNAKAVRSARPVSTISMNREPDGRSS